MEKLFILIKPSTLDSGKKVSKMVKENLLSLTPIFMMETGKTVKCTEMGLTNQMGQKLMENGNTEI